VCGVLAVATLTSCGDEGPAAVDGVEVPDGFAVSEVAGGLNGPTQFVRDEDRLLVAQLNGEEGGGTGQVVATALDDAGEADGDPSVLFEDLAKPTGVEVVAGEIWVMEERRLSRGPLDGGELTTVLDELPFNGRSEGTLTAIEDGRLLYDTSGTLDGTEAAEGSGILWSLTPGGEPVEVARGFKHAYARTFDADGTLWQGEMSDGSYDGEPAPDELVAVEEGDDFGWPRCVGDGTPVDLYGGTEESCAETPPSHALFEPGATPTSVAVAPWDPDTLLVALWNQGRIVSVPRDGGEDGPVEVEDFLTGLERPQHLLADGDRLLVGDYTGGRILSVTADG